MVLNSLGFVLFFGVLFALYYSPFKPKWNFQNVLLVVASYVFYALGDWRFAPLLLGSTVLYFGLGLAVQKSEGTKWAIRYTNFAVVLGIGLLIYFKYFDFFIDSFASLLRGVGLDVSWTTLNIIVPLGISYFTFKLISYVVEIHRGKLEATHDFVGFSAYVSFFPTIVSGPIDKPNGFLPQLSERRSFNYAQAVDGCRQILWGLAQKTLIADGIAGTISHVWSDVPGASGSSLVFAALLFAVQLYTDFAGYSHMAIGVGKVLGFRIASNFQYPFFATSIAEFWRKWHMSLTSWLTEYVFMPLNIKFRNLGKKGMMLAIVINLLVVGMWHGANWTFFVFGLFHGLLFIPSISKGSFFKKKKLKPNKWGLPTPKDFGKMVGVFLLIAASLILFRAPDIQTAADFVKGMFSPSLLSLPYGAMELMGALFFMAVFFAVEWKLRKKEHPFVGLQDKWNTAGRWALYLGLVVLIILYSGGEQEFIYQQF